MKTIRTPFRMAEEILQGLDQPDEPSTIQIELRVSGSFDEQALQTAVETAVRAHPMLRARRASRRVLFRAARWEIGEPSLHPVLTSVRCADETSLSADRA